MRICITQLCALHNVTNIVSFAVRALYCSLTVRSRHGRCSRLFDLVVIPFAVLHVICANGSHHLCTQYLRSYIRLLCAYHIIILTVLNGAHVRERDVVKTRFGLAGSDVILGGRRHIGSRIVKRRSVRANVSYVIIMYGIVRLTRCSVRHPKRCVCIFSRFQPSVSAGTCGGRFFFIVCAYAAMARPGFPKRGRGTENVSEIVSLFGDLIFVFVLVTCNLKRYNN